MRSATNAAEEGSDVKEETEEGGEGQYEAWEEDRVPRLLVGVAGFETIHMNGG